MGRVLKPCNHTYVKYSRDVVGMRKASWGSHAFEIFLFSCPHGLLLIMKFPVGSNFGEVIPSTFQRHHKLGENFSFTEITEITENKVTTNIT